MHNTLREAIRLRRMGFAIHWLQPRSKVPVAFGWADAPVMNEQALTTSFRPGFNIGFRPGKWSIVEGSEICVLDVDLRGGSAYAEEAYAAAATMLKGKFAPNVLSGSGPGRHQYLAFPIGKSPAGAATTLRQSDIWIDSAGQVCAAGTKDARPAWLIELLSTGKNVVMPPSIHPDTLKPYLWANECPP